MVRPLQTKNAPSLLGKPQIWEEFQKGSNMSYFTILYKLDSNRQIANCNLINTTVRMRDTF